MRVWNPLMAQFAGYNNNSFSDDNGCPSQKTTKGDQGNLEFTQVTN